MTRALRIGACVAALTLAATPAAADWHFTPFVGWTLGGSTTFVDPENKIEGTAFGRGHQTIGGFVTRLGRRALGAEAMVAWVPGIFDRGDQLLVLSSHTFAAMGNVVLTIPREWNEHGLRPYVSGGLGLLRVSQRNFADALPVRRRALAYNAGGGAVGFLSNRVGVRFDLRYVDYVSPGPVLGFSLDAERLSYWAGTVGVVVRY